MDDDQQIDVFDNSGQRGQIPVSSAHTAFSERGFKYATQDDSGAWKPTQPVMVTDPKGNAGWLPVNQVDKAVKERGFTVGQPLTKSAGDTVVNGKFTPGNPQPANAFTLESLNKINDAAKGTGHVLKVGGKTLLKMAADPTPSGAARAISEEAMEQQQNGGIPHSKDVVAAPFREFAGVRQPGESATLGFTGHDPSQQGVLTQTANAMDNLMGGDPAAARSHFSQAATHTANNNPQAASDENQRGYADMLAVPLATVGTSRLFGETPIAPLTRKAVSSTASAIGDIPFKKITFPESRSWLANQIVKPLVRRPVGKTLEDVRFGRSAAAGITDEGLMGTQNGLVTKTQARIGELSDTIDSQLQNHANSNVQIDAAPIIDHAVDGAIEAARKTGNQGIVTRLENLRSALTTEYGPTRGTPFDINNLKRQVGGVASDLGAFKSTDPVEASAASAMQDVYTGLKNAVNQQAPEVAPLNERVANLVTAQTALKRNLALAEGKPYFEGMSPGKLPFKIYNSVANSGPVRTGAARLLNLGNKLDVPDIPQIQRPIAPVGRQIGQGAIITPQPANPNGPVINVPPPIAATTRAQRMGLLLPQNATPPPIRLGAGPAAAEAAAAGSPIAATTRAQRLGLMLPEAPKPPIRLGPEPPELGVTPAARRVVYDPVTGKSKVQFLTSAADGQPLSPLDVELLKNPRAAESRFIQSEHMGGLDVPTGRPEATAALESGAAPPMTRGMFENQPAPPPITRSPATPIEGVEQRSPQRLDPTGATAAKLSMLRDELVREADPVKRADIQQAIDHYVATAQGVPFHPPSQDVVENLPARQPREIEPGIYNRETKTTTPAGKTVMVPTKDIKVKPDVMQFRTDADPVTGEQAGRSMEGVKFDQELAGPVKLWKDPQTGETLLADGHHRLALANRSGISHIEGRYIDAPTAEAARGRAAFSNIAEGNASLFDAAKFFREVRDTGLDPVQELAKRNISLSSGISKSALSLSNLDSSLFDKVRSGQLSEAQGSIIGEATSDPAIQESIIKEMDSRAQRGRSVTDGNVSELAKLAKLTGTKTETTMDLFGGHQETTGLLGEFADAMSQVRRDLSSRKSTFGAVSKESKAKALSSVEGQSINAGENARISQEAAQLGELFDKFSTSPGPVNDLLMDAAKKMATKSPKEARIVREGVSPQVIEELRKMLPGGDVPRPPRRGPDAATK